MDLHLKKFTLMASTHLCEIVMGDRESHTYMGFTMTWPIFLPQAYTIASTLSNKQQKDGSTSGWHIEKFQHFILFQTQFNNSDNIFCETSYFLVNKNLLGLLERVQHNVIIIYVILSRWRYTSGSFILLNMFAKSILLFFCRSLVGIYHAASGRFLAQLFITAPMISGGRLATQRTPCALLTLLQYTTWCRRCICIKVDKLRCYFYDIKCTRILCCVGDNFSYDLLVNQKRTLE